MSVKLVFLDGPPCAGKSTILSALEGKYGADVYPEPRPFWDPFLSQMSFYEGELKRSRNTDEFATMQRRFELALVTFQSMVLAWYQVLKDSIDEYGSGTVVVERSPASAKVFHALAMQSKWCTDECKAQLRAIAAQLPKFETKHTVVHLKIDPSCLVSRLHHRCAAGDAHWDDVRSIELYYSMYDQIVKTSDTIEYDVDVKQTPEDLATLILTQIAP